MEVLIERYWEKNWELIYRLYYTILHMHIF